MSGASPVATCRHFVVAALSLVPLACGNAGSHGAMRFIDDGRTDAGTRADAKKPDAALLLPDGGASDASWFDSSIRIDSHVALLEDAAAGTETGAELCVPGPALPPTGPQCGAPGYNAASERHVLWVEDPNAPGTGVRLDLVTGETGGAFGHTYRSTGNGLFGGGAHGVYGDALFDVDSVRDALRFHLEGCAVPDSVDRWTLEGALTKTTPLSSVPETVARNYRITRTGSGASERYTFVLEGAPAGCGTGVDLVGVTEF